MKCSLCNNETTCEECKKEKKEDFKHICFECYKKKEGKVDTEKTHVCIPPEELSKAYDRFIGDTINHAFNDLWDAEKKKLKELSKQDLARTSFFEGANFMLEFMRRISQENEK
ncbi:hypothetical protein KKB44_03650 [Candidatus Micrarchaeota archaeon]|nr:hypothetical protein [Candidatus Micrarchaeota archaeon]